MALPSSDGVTSTQDPPRMRARGILRGACCSASAPMIKRLRRVERLLLTHGDPHLLCAAEAQAIRSLPCKQGFSADMLNAVADAFERAAKEFA